MLSGIALLAVILLAVIFIIVTASVFKLHPFLSLLLATLLTGLAVGVPLKQILEAVNQGFGNLLGSIGLVVVLGSMIGIVLEKSGAALQIANLVITLVGKNKPVWAMGIIGSIVAIPVFCDSAFIILSGLAKALAKKTGKNFSALALSLAGGLYTTHVLIPPTPGPLACAGNLGLSEHIGLVILLGLAVSIPSTFVAIIFANKINKNIENQANVEEDKEVQHLPSPFLSVLPIFLPIILIAFASFIPLFQFSENATNLIQFIGSPLIALCLGLLVSFFLVPKWNKNFLNDLMGKGITQAGTILILTGAGGAFGALLKATPVAQMVNDWVADSQVSGVWLLMIGFLIAALLKTAQGSSTSALVITSSMLAPLLQTVGLDSPTEISLLVMAIGGGAMTVSHANDSYFWVVSQFGHFSLKEAYRSLTLMSFLQGLSVLLSAVVLFILVRN
ncbi:MAG: GntP family permease [Thermoflexibacter sp.]